MIWIRLKMSSFIVFTYQHTCKTGHDAYILQNAPFKAVKKKSPNGGPIKIPFLGEGYYFWEENIDAAIRWGKKHYDNKYSIVEYIDVNILDDELLNLTNRRNIQYFKELQAIYIQKRPACEKWRLGTWIEFFKKLRDQNEVNFPFKYIRADEHLPEKEELGYNKEKTFFADGLPYYTFLSPLLMLCVLDKKELKFKEKRIHKE